jgi:hypothetical protein
MQKFSQMKTFQLGPGLGPGHIAQLPVIHILLELIDTLGIVLVPGQHPAPDRDAFSGHSQPDSDLGQVISFVFGFAICQQVRVSGIFRAGKAAEAGDKALEGRHIQLVSPPEGVGDLGILMNILRKS